MESLTLVKWNTGEEIYLGGIQCKLLNSVKASGKKTVETNMQYIYIYTVFLEKCRAYQAKFILVTVHTMD